jgi:hypothetical protein
MTFSSRVKKYYESRLIYECLHDENPAIYLLFGLCNDLAASFAIEQGKIILEDLKRGILHEFTDYNTEEVTKYENYIRTGKMKHDMGDLAKDGETIGNLLFRLFEPIWNLTTIDLNNIINEKTQTLIELIKNIDTSMHEADPDIFETNFFKLMNRTDWTETEREYQKEKNRRCVTMEWLQEKQERELQKMLQMDIMCYADEPSTQFLENVDYPYHRGHLSCKFVDNLDYKNSYAKFMHYATRKENLIIPDYKTYGKYIALYHYKFRPEQKKALLELIYILHLIHKDMVELKPELGKYLGISGDESIEGTKYFAIYINMVKMFERDWFERFSSGNQYNLKWIKRFMNDLLRSEWRDDIADDWYKPDKVLSVKGNIIGCLKKAGLLNGSDLSIASAIINGDERDHKTFAIYMGKGKKMPYCDWICDYVRH